MNRRESIAAILMLGAAAALPFVALAQAARGGKVWRVGIATDFDSPEMRLRFVGFLRDLGWIETRNFTPHDTGLAYGSPAEEVARRVPALAPDVIVTSGPALWFTRPAILKHATSKRIPTIADFAQAPDNVAERLLLSYAPSWDELLRQTVSFVGWILDGARAGELPIQLPAKFELEVNLKVARAIGLKVPQSVLLCADRAID